MTYGRRAPSAGGRVVVTTVKLLRELATTPLELPEGSMPVGTCRLSQDPSAMLVSFPPGWQREAAGQYADAEEFIVLAGALAMNDEVHRAGTWVLVPGQAARRGTRTPEGALAIAWFDDGARWSTDARPGAVRETHVDLGRARQTSGQTPFGPGRTLRRRRSWWVNELRPGPDDVTRQVVTTGADGPVLLTVAAGTPMPTVDGPCFVRADAEVR